MDGARIAGNCSDCSSSLSRALVREVRHYEKTHLLEVTCGICERTFLVIEEEAWPVQAFQIEDVLLASASLISAQVLSDLFAKADLDLSDEA
jgi:hypothetical protein